jgi:hypothetical protein
VAGARVEPVQAQVTGGSDAPDLAEADAVALVPTGWPVGAGNVRLRVEDDVTLPLVLLSMTGTASPVVRRIVSRLSPAG